MKVSSHIFLIGAGIIDIDGRDQHNQRCSPYSY
jgi:hypothetical protein